MMTVKEIFRGSDRLTPKQQKFREIVMYLFCGGLTTLANIVTFAIFDYFVKAEMPVSIFGWNFDLILLINQSISWLVAVIVAYVTNRAFVFVSNGSIIKEFLGFVAARIVTFFVIELGVFALLVMICENVMGIPDETTIFTIFGYNVTYLLMIKIAYSVLLIIVNYVLSKLFIFKKHPVPEEKR